MKNCININDPEFQKLYKELKETRPELSVEFLASKVAVWQELNGLDKLPTIDDFSSIKKDISDYYNSTIKNRDGKIISSKKVLSVSKFLTSTTIKTYNDIKDKITSIENSMAAKALSPEKFKENLETIKELKAQLTLENLFSEQLEVLENYSTLLYELTEEGVEYDEEFHGDHYNIPNDSEIWENLYWEYEDIIENFDKYKEIISNKLEVIGYKLVNRTIKEEEYNEESESEQEGEEGAVNTKSYDKNSLEENPINKLSAKVKWFLHSIPDGTLNHLYQPSLVDFQQVYQDLLRLLSNSGRDQNIMRKILEVESENKPYIKNLLERLDGSSQELINAFYTAMVNNTGNHVTLIQNKKVIKPINTVSTDKKSLILEEWANNVYNEDSIYGVDELGRLQIDPEKVKEAELLFESLNDLDKLKQADYFYDDDYLFAKTRIFLNKLGITLSSVTLKAIKENWEVIAKSKTFRVGTKDQTFKANAERKFKTLFEEAKKNDTLEEFYNQAFWISRFNTGFLNRFNDFIKKESTIYYKKEDSEDSEVKDDAEVDSEIDARNKTIALRESASKALAYYEALYNPKLGVSNYRNGDGKTIYNHNDYDAVSLEFIKLIGEGNIPNKEYIQKLLEVDYLRESQLLNDLNLPEGNEIFEKIIKAHFKVEYLDSLKNYEGKNAEAKLYKDMSPREKLITNLSLFSNSSHESLAKYITPTKSDKHLVQVLTWRKFKENDTEEILKIIKSEYSRYFNSQKDKENTTKFEDYVPNFFYHYPELNDRAKFPELYYKNGNLKPYNAAVMDKILTERVVNPVLEQELTDLIDKLTSEGIIIKNEKSVLIFNKQITSEFTFSGFGSVENFLKSFVLSTKVAQFNSLSVFSGDIAFFAKGKYDINTDPTIFAKKAFDNAFKRLAKDIAPYRPTIKSDHFSEIYDQAESYKVLVTKDPKGISVNIKQLSKILGDSFSNFEGIDSADAIELTNPLEFIFELYSKNKITLDQYNHFKKLFTINKNGTFTELQKSDKKILNSVAFTSSKPVFVGWSIQEDTEGHTVRVPLYIKSSRFPLIPQVLQGTEFEKLNKFMGKNKIATLTMKTAFKIGSKKQLEIFDNDTLTVKDSILDLTEDQLEDHIHTLDREFFGHQQDIPFDEFKDEILEGSQLAALLFQGLLSQEKFQKLKAEYNEAHIDLLDMQWEAFSSEFGVSLNESTDKYEFTNLSKVKKVILTELKKRSNYSENDLLYLELNEEGSDFEIPLWASPNANKYESLLTSFISKKVLKHKLPGRSYVLVPEVGIKGSAKEITYTKEEDLIGTAYDPETGLKPQRFGYVYNDVKYEEETFKEEFSDMSSEEMENYKTVFPAQIIIPYSNNNSIKGIAYRVPTQGPNSTSAVEVVGFLPKYYGEIVIAPQDLIIQMGSDFDIDKLYIHKWNQNISESLEIDIDSMMAEEELELNKKTLLNKKKIAQNNILDIMWETMTAPERLKDILSPLDQAMIELKEEAKKIEKTNPEKAHKFLTVLKQVENYEAGVAGKDMIGKSSILSVLLAKIENTDLGIERIMVSKSEGGFEFYTQPYDWKFKKPSKGTSKQESKSWVVNDITESKNLTGGSKIYSLSSFQSASVDNIKELILSIINYNSNTHNAASSLFALGLDHNFVAQFISQPIILEHTKNLINVDMYNEMGFLESKKNSYLKLKKELKDKMKQILNKNNVIENEEALNNYLEKMMWDGGYNWNTAFNTEDLRKSRNFEDTFKYYATQYALLEKFEKLDEFGKKIGDIAYVSRFANRGMGKSLIDTLHSINKTEDSLEDIGIKNLDKFLDSEKTIEGKSFDIVKKAFQAFAPLYNLDSTLYKYLFEGVSTLKGVKVGQLSDKERGQILRFAKSYLFSSNNLNIYENENIEDLRKRLLQSDVKSEKITTIINKEANISTTKLKIEIIRPSLPLRWKNYLKANPKHPFASKFNFDLTNGKGVDAIKYYKSQEDKLSSLDSIMTIVSMLNSENSQEVLLAKDLIKYYYITGANLGSTSLAELIPSGYLLHMNFGENIKETNKDLEVNNLKNILISYAQHYPYIVPSLKEGLVKKYPAKKGIINLPIDQEQGNMFLSNKKLYLYQGVSENSHVYVQIDTKGYLRNNIFELSIDDANSRTLIANKKSPITDYTIDGFSSPEKNKAHNSNIEEVEIDNSINSPETSISSLALYENNIEKTLTKLSNSNNQIISSVASFILEEGKLSNLEVIVLNDLEFDNEVSSEANGAYKNNTLYIRDSLDFESLETVVLHEIIHHVTDEILSTSKENLSPRVLEIISNLEQTIVFTETLYKKEFNKSHSAFSSTKEFVAEVLSNKEFIENLEKLPFKKSNMLQRIFELLAELIGVNLKGKVSQIKEVEKIMNTAAEIIKNEKNPNTIKTNNPLKTSPQNILNIINNFDSNEFENMDNDEGLYSLINKDITKDDLKNIVPEDFKPRCFF